MKLKTTKSVVFIGFALFFSLKNSECYSSEIFYPNNYPTIENSRTIEINETKQTGYNYTNDDFAQAPKPSPTKKVDKISLNKLPKPKIEKTIFKKGKFFEKNKFYKKKPSPLELAFDDNNKLRNINEIKKATPKSFNNVFPSLFEKKPVELKKEKKQASIKIAKKKTNKEIRQKQKTFILPINIVNKNKPKKIVKQEIALKKKPPKNKKASFLIPIQTKNSVDKKENKETTKKQNKQIALIDSKQNIKTKNSPASAEILEGEKISIPQKPKGNIWKPESLVNKPIEKEELNLKNTKETIKKSLKASKELKKEIMKQRNKQLASVWSKLPVDDAYYELDEDQTNSNKKEPLIYGKKVNSYSPTNKDTPSENKLSQQKHKKKAKFIRAKNTVKKENKKKRLLKPMKPKKEEMINQEDFDQASKIFENAKKSSLKNQASKDGNDDNLVGSFVNKISTLFNEDKTDTLPQIGEDEIKKDLEEKRQEKQTNTFSPLDFDVFSSAKKQQGQRILPAEIKLSFQNDKASISGHTLQWINAFAKKVAKDESSALEVRMSKAAPPKLRSLRFSLLRNILLSKGVLDYQIHPIFTNRQPNTLVIRTFKVNNFYTQNDYSKFPSTQAQTNQLYTNW